MSYGLRQSLLIALAGLSLLVVTALLARRQRMSLRYAILWSAIALAGILGALLTPLVKPISELFGMSPTGLLLAGISTILLTITMLLSMSVSGIQAQLREVAEAHALLAQKMDEMAASERHGDPV